MSASDTTGYTKRLTKHGNSLALVIDRPILDLLGIREDTPISLRTDGRCLILTPVTQGDRRARVKKAMAKVHGKYAKALKRLAE